MKKMILAALAAVMMTVGLAACNPPPTRYSDCYAQVTLHETFSRPASAGGIWEGVGIWARNSQGEFERVTRGDFRPLLGAPPFNFRGKYCIANPEQTKRYSDIEYYDDGSYFAINR